MSAEPLTRARGAEVVMIAQGPGPSARKPQPSAELDSFVWAAAQMMRDRLQHGWRKFGGSAVGWRRGYSDAHNEERLRRAVDHLIAARANSVDPDEWQKRAADVANQAFMYADEKRR